MSDKDGVDRHDITGILRVLSQIFGRSELAIILLFVLISVIVMGGYSVYTFASRRSYSDLARNFKELSEINTRRLDNLKKILNIKERLEKELEDLESKIEEKKDEIGTLVPPSSEK